MAKWKPKGITDTAEPEDTGSFNDYDGPIPPKGVYPGKLVLLRIKENSNGDDMLNGLVEIIGRGEKRKYNGAPVWFNQNVTDQARPYVNQFLKSIGATWADFISGNVQVDNEDQPGIIKIGKVKIGDNPLKIATKMGEYLGEPKAEIARFIFDDGSTAEDDSEDGEEGGDDSTAIDTDAQGNGDDAEDQGGDTSAEGNDDDLEPYTAQELEDMTTDELAEVIKDEFEAEVPAKGRKNATAYKALLVKKILELQDEDDENGEAADVAAEETGGVTDGEEPLTKEELEAMEPDEIKELAKDLGVQLTGRFIKSRAITKILAAQDSNPPF